MMQDLADWKPRPHPERKLLEGRYVRLEPLQAAKHSAELYSAVKDAHENDRFRYSLEHAPEDRDGFSKWIATCENSSNPLYFAVVVKETNKVSGYQSLTRIVPCHGSIGVGHVFYGASLSRTQAATEAQYLAATYVFDELKYRRYEWKCDNANEASKKAAVRFGFTLEAVFRQCNVMRGRNRDSAWYSIIDSEWPVVRRAYEAWLDHGNFDQEGRQISRLEDIRAALKPAIDSGAALLHMTEEG